MKLTVFEDHAIDRLHVEAAAGVGWARTELRACYPGDICNILQSIGTLRGRPPAMTKPELERATALYFAKN